MHPINAAYDPRNQRLTFFDVTGELLRTESTLSDQTARSVLAYFLWAPLGDGSYLRIRNRLYEVTKRGVHRDSTVWTRGRPDGSDLDTIGRFPGFEYYAEGLGRGEYAPLTFGLRFVVLGHGLSFYVGAGDEFRIDRYTLDGALEMSFRRAFQRHRVTSADVEALRQRQLDAAPSDASRRRIERRYRDYPHAEEMPAHGGRMLVDLQHNLWVEEYMGPRDSIPRYTVFAGEGDFLGDVAMPARFEPRHIGSEYVLGVWRAADDVEHVQLYDLIKPEQ